MLLPHPAGLFLPDVSSLTRIILWRERKRADKNYDEFVGKVAARTAAILGDGYSVSRQDVVKNNGVVCRQIVISDTVHAVSPCIGMDAYYELYRGQDDIQTVAADIAGWYQGLDHGEPDAAWVSEWGQVRDKVMFQLVNTGRNRVQLEDMPHRDLPGLGLSAVCYLLIGMGEQLATIKIRNSHVRMWGVSAEEVLQYAQQNTPEKMHARMCSILKVLGKCTGQDGGQLQKDIPEGMVIQVLTNEQKLYGAGCMLYKGVLDQAAEKFASDLYILPSSVHEVLLLPVPGKIGAAPGELRGMVRGINAYGEVLEEEILSDEVYLYDRTERKLVIAE